jgi:hypothetical protein
MFYLHISKKAADDHKTDQMVRLAPTQCIDSRQCCHPLGMISRPVRYRYSAAEGKMAPRKVSLFDCIMS